MAKTDNLTDFLVDLADAIREKKGTSNPINPQDFSSEIASIESGGGEFSWDFSRIGYTSENTTLLQQFEDAIAYAEGKARTFTPSKVSSLFSSDKKLVFAPMVDVSGVTNIRHMFSDCTALTSIPQLNTSNVTHMSSMFTNCSALTSIPQLNTSNVTEMTNLFTNCTALTSIPQLNTSNVTNMNYMFSGCSALTSIPQLNTSNVTNMSYMFSGCSALTSIPQLDTSNATSMNNMFQNCSALVYCLIKNIGKSTLTTYDFSGAKNWGTGGEENRQSLIDSLITYSYDRASNEMAIATIKLSRTTKALLTEEEIAQITAKGFTIA